MIPQPHYPAAITEPIGDLTPVKPGGCGHYYMRCSAGHEGLYMGTTLRRAAKLGSPMRCRDCVAAARGSR
jgi:hypothetical protein